VYRPDIAIRKPQGKLLAFAPGRSHLRYAAQERQKASTFFSQNLVLLNRHATETAFKHQAEDFEIIHLGDARLLR
jgi:hypothetical protein